MSSATRRRRRLARQGGPYIRPSDVRPSLPLPHESVRRLGFEDLFERSPYAALDVPRLHVARPVRAASVRVGSMPASPRPRAMRRRAGLSLLSRLPSVGKRTLVCVGRRIRREVIFSLGLGGLAKISKKKHWRRSKWSVYPC